MFCFMKYYLIILTILIFNIYISTLSKRRKVYEQRYYIYFFLFLSFSAQLDSVILWNHWNPSFEE